MTIVAATMTALVTPLGAANAAAPNANAEKPSSVDLSDPQSTDNLPADILAVMRYQESMEPAVELIYDGVEEVGGAGFAGLAFEGHQLSLYWKGATPPSITARIGQARSFGDVEIKQAAFSRSELRAAAHAIMALYPRSTDLQSVSVLEDGSGLEVVRADAESRSARDKALRAKGKVGSLVEELLHANPAGVPVRYRTAKGPIKFLSCSGPCNRLNDTSPWNGGTRVQITGTAYGTIPCTTGFGVKKNSTTYVVTASHCTNPSNLFYDWTGEFMGGVYQDSWANDITLINARGFYKIFDGGIMTTNTKKVYSASDPVSGQLLCHSGSYSGTVCNLRAGNCDHEFYLDRDSDGDSFMLFNMCVMECLDCGVGEYGAIGGDSGGPVFTLHGDGVRAKGTISAGENAYVYFEGWSKIANTFGVVIKTPYN